MNSSVNQAAGFRQSEDVPVKITFSSPEPPGRVKIIINLKQRERRAGTEAGDWEAEAALLPTRGAPVPSVASQQMAHFPAQVPICP